MDVPEFLTVREVAALLKISPDSVTRRFQNEEAAQKLGDKLAKAVVDAEKDSDDFRRLAASKQKSSHSQKMEVF